MRRTYERGTKARLSLSGGPHAPVNMADSMQNAGSSTISGSKEAMEVSKNSNDLRKLGARNIGQYNAANVPRMPFSSPTFTSWPAREAKPRFDAALDRRCAHDRETRL